MSSSQSAGRRRRGLDALRAVGLRDEQVSVALSACLNDGQAGDDELLCSGLLATAHLRDSAQAPYAIAALGSENWQVVQAAAKVLTELPEVDAFPALQEALERWLPGGGPPTGHWVIRQLLAALVTLGLPEAEQLVLMTIRQALRGRTGLYPVEAVWAADELGLPTARALILEHLAHRLEKVSSDGIVWHSVSRLGAT